MRFEEMPGLPKIWLDFVNSGIAELPVCTTLEAVADCGIEDRFRSGRTPELMELLSAGAVVSPAASENIQKLARPGSLAVVAILRPALFGGPLRQLLKCLTAVKLCEALNGISVPAVPIGWIDQNLPRDFRPLSLTLLGGKNEIRIIECSSFNSTPGEIPLILESLRQFGAFDPETLELLAASFTSGDSPAAATRRLFSLLMRDWGMLVLDPGAPELSPITNRAFEPLGRGAAEIEELLQKRRAALAAHLYEDPFAEERIPSFLMSSALLPVAAFIVDPSDVYAMAEAFPVYDHLGLAMPHAWPQASATVGDAKARRVLSRYNIPLTQLYRGEDETLQSILRTLPHGIPDMLQSAESETELQIEHLKTLAASDKPFIEAAESCREKVVYQLGKLREHAVAALKSREQTIDRHIRQACRRLAPNGRPQEKELAGIQIPLDYTAAGLRTLQEKLNLFALEHQLIWMD